jgi:hypothetical protein
VLTVDEGPLEEELRLLVEDPESLEVLRASGSITTAELWEHLVYGHGLGCNRQLDVSQAAAKHRTGRSSHTSTSTGRVFVTPELPRRSPASDLADPVAMLRMPRPPWVHAPSRSLTLVATPASSSQPLSDL